MCELGMFALIHMKCSVDIAGIHFVGVVGKFSGIAYSVQVNRYNISNACKQR